MALTPEQTTRLRSILLRHGSDTLRRGTEFLADLILNPELPKALAALVAEEQQAVAEVKAELPDRRTAQDAAIAADEKLLAELKTEIEKPAVVSITTEVKK